MCVVRKLQTALLKQLVVVRFNLKTILIFSICKNSNNDFCQVVVSVKISNLLICFCSFDLSNLLICFCSFDLSNLLICFRSFDLSCPILEKSYFIKKMCIVLFN